MFECIRFLILKRHIWWFSFWNEDDDDFVWRMEMMMCCVVDVLFNFLFFTFFYFAENLDWFPSSHAHPILSFPFQFSFFIFINSCFYMHALLIFFLNSYLHTWRARSFNEVTHRCWKIQNWQKGWIMQRG